VLFNGPLFFYALFPALPTCFSNVVGCSRKPGSDYDASTSMRAIKRVDFLCTVLTTTQHKRKHKNIKNVTLFPYAYVIAYACALSCVVVRTRRRQHKHIKNIKASRLFIITLMLAL
jgi:hypothetical protein